MNTEQLLSAIGPIILDGEHYDSRVVTGNYGNAIITDNGYVLGDPCYLLAGGGTRHLGDSYPRFNAKRREMFPPARDGERNTDGKLLRMAEWHEMEFDGEKCYWRDTGGDGVGYFGLCVDAGWIAAIPLRLCNEDVKSVFAEITPA